MRRKIGVLVLVVAAFGLGQASAEPVIPDGSFVRDSAGNTWLVTGSQRAAVQVVGGHEVGAAVVATGLRGDNITANRLRRGFIGISAVVAARHHGFVTVTASSHQAACCEGGCQGPYELLFLHIGKIKGL